MIEATFLPDAIDVDDIAENALQAAFKTIADGLASAGYPVTGDVSPGEAIELDRLFQGFVRMMALNNDDIAALTDREPTDDEIYNGPGREGGIGYDMFDGPGSLGENDYRL